MPSVIGSILALARRQGRSIGTCAVCGSSVRERDERFDLHGSTRVHLACATYRMRSERARARGGGGRVTARRSALHLGD